MDFHPIKLLERKILIKSKILETKSYLYNQAIYFAKKKQMPFELSSILKKTCIWDFNMFSDPKKGTNIKNKNIENLLQKSKRLIKVNKSIDKFKYIKELLNDSKEKVYLFSNI